MKLSYAYSFNEIPPAYDMLKRNAGGFFSPESTIMHTCPISLSNDIIGLDLDVDFYQVAIVLISKKKLKDPAFAAIVKELNIQNVC